MAKKRKSIVKEASGTKSSHSKQSHEDAAPPRDLQSEEKGVPRGDWSDDPLQPDADGREGLRSNFDGHYTPRENQ